MLILASASPARAELLRQAGFDPIIMPVDLDEDSFKTRISNPEELVCTLAEAKSNLCLENLRRGGVFPPCAIVSADTIVYFQNHIIGKPKDRAEAKVTITALQGNSHIVWTGACVLSELSPELVEGVEELHSKKIISDHATVTFKPMTDAQIETYLDTNDWVGAAGAYRLKKSIHPFVEKVNGDEATVIGLPEIAIQTLL